MEALGSRSAHDLTLGRSWRQDPVTRGAAKRWLIRREPVSEHLTRHAWRIGLEPDLTWWDGRACEFVGDAKYKRIDDRTVPDRAG